MQWSCVGCDKTSDNDVPCVLTSNRLPGARKDVEIDGCCGRVLSRMKVQTSQSLLPH